MKLACCLWELGLCKAETGAPLRVWCIGCEAEPRSCAVGTITRDTSLYYTTSSPAGFYAHGASASNNPHHQCVQKRICLSFFVCFVFVWFFLELRDVYSKADHRSGPGAHWETADHPHRRTLVALGFHLTTADDLMVFQTASRERGKQIHNKSETKTENLQAIAGSPPLDRTMRSALRRSALQRAPAPSAVVQLGQTRGGPNKSASRRPISAWCIPNDVGGAIRGGAIAPDPTHRSFVISMFIMAPE